jgi:hypothetical protein
MQLIRLHRFDDIHDNDSDLDHDDGSDLDHDDGSNLDFGLLVLHSTVWMSQNCHRKVSREGVVCVEIAAQNLPSRQIRDHRHGVGVEAKINSRGTQRIHERSECRLIKIFGLVGDRWYLLHQGCVCVIFGGCIDLY